MSATYVDIADYENLRNALHFGLDVGVYHDLALTLRLPVVLSDTRSLSSPDGRMASEVNDELLLPVPPDSEGRPRPPEQLFSVPFQSPARSGIPWIEVGVAWALFNQHRS